MKTKIGQILSDIKKKKNELYEEYSKLREKYGFTFQKGKVVFNTEVKKKNKAFKQSILDSIFSARVREILSIPFIYGMIIPSVILHVCLVIYQQTAFRLYNIPIVKLSDYVVYDRRHLDYLNFLQKINCMYCSYVNGVYSYAVEVAGRTEKYWCPIKHAKKLKGGHDWHEHFADYGDPKGFEKCFTNNDAYYDKANSK